MAFKYYIDKDILPDIHNMINLIIQDKPLEVMNHLMNLEEYLKNNQIEFNYDKKAKQSV